MQRLNSLSVCYMCLTHEPTIQPIVTGDALLKGAIAFRIYLDNYGCDTKFCALRRQENGEATQLISLRRLTPPLLIHFERYALSRLSEIVALTEILG